MYASFSTSHARPFLFYSYNQHFHILLSIGLISVKISRLSFLCKYFSTVQIFKITSFITYNVTFKRNRTKEQKDTERILIWLPVCYNLQLQSSLFNVLLIGIKLLMALIWILIIIFFSLWFSCPKLKLIYIYIYKWQICTLSVHKIISMNTFN